jgi:hypothetical protein
MIQMHKADNPTGPARREKGEIHMFTRTRMLQVTGMVVALALLAACGGGGITYTINAGTQSGKWPWFWPDKADYIVDGEFSRNVPVAGQSRIRLDSVNGEIVVTGQPDATSVTVAAELIVGSNVSLLDAEISLDRLKVLVTDRFDEISVQTVQPMKTEGRQYVVNYHITVPRDLSVEVTQVNGHVTVEDIEGSLFVGLVNGSIDGTVTLPAGGEITLSTVNGDIDLRIPASTSAELSALVEFGAVTWDNLDLQNAVHLNRSLTGTLGGGAGLVELETGNGNIVVTGFDG